MSGSLPGYSHPQTLDAPLPPPPSVSLRAAVGFEISAATLDPIDLPFAADYWLVPEEWQAGLYRGGVEKRSRLSERPDSVESD